MMMLFLLLMGALGFFTLLLLAAFLLMGLWGFHIVIACLLACLLLFF